MRVQDLALIELFKTGRTDAPAGALTLLAGEGYLTLGPAGPALTARGKKRAFRLKESEHDLRTMSEEGIRGPGGMTLRAVPAGGAPRRRG